MMKPWQAPFNKAPSKDKGGKEVQRGRTQVRARKDLGKQPMFRMDKHLKTLGFPP